MSGCYDARKAGANCDQCPLREQEPLAPIAPPEASIAIIGRAPDTTAIKYSRPYTGPAGTMLTRALHLSGQHPGDCHYTYAMLCETPGGDYESYLRELSKHNKKREKDGKEPILPPHECCAPRLAKEIAHIDNIIALGKQGANSILGGNNSILSIRGALEIRNSPSGGDRKIMPTVTPNFVFVRPRWSHVFNNDIRKAIKWFKGDAPWNPPEAILNPPVHELREFLSDKTTKYTFDVETDGIECLTAKLRCIGIGNGRGKYISVGFRSNRWPKEYVPEGVDPQSPEALVLDFYYGDDKAEVVSLCKQFFADPEIIKVAHNGGYYDFLVILKQLGVEIPLVSLRDTIIAHRNVESEMPHTLAYVTSLYAFSPAWKCDREGNKIALGGETDEQLHKYCVTDVQNTEAVYPELGQLVAKRKAGKLVQMDHQIQRICAHMHATGMYVDQKRRLAREKEGLARRHKVLSEIQNMTGWKDFNPGSTQQLQELVYERWKAKPDVDEKDLYTDTGNKATGDIIMRALLTDRRVPQEQREVVKRIRIFRKTQKILGTYVTKLRPHNMEAESEWDEDDDWVDQESRRLYGEVKRGIVDPRTGRMYPGYSAHVTATGRLSSSKPINAQNFPGELRDMVIAAPGHILVGADMDQLELRIAAARWGVKLYLRAFEEGKDPHSMTAFACFGMAFCQGAGIDPAAFKKPGILKGNCYDEHGVFDKNKADKETKKMRDLSKIVQYLSQYKGSAETGWKSLRKTEVPAKDPATGKYYDDGTTDLPYALMPLSKYREMHANWLRGAPEFVSGWDMELSTYRKYGYLWEPVTGRRRDFLDGENPNEIVNYPIQSSAAGLMNRAIIALFDALGAEPWGPGTGIINQCHDSIVVECPLDGATYDSQTKKWNIPVGSIPWRVGKLLEECMCQEHPALPGVKFTASAAFGRTWKEVG